MPDHKASITYEMKALTDIPFANFINIKSNLACQNQYQHPINNEDYVPDGY